MNQITDSLYGSLMSSNMKAYYVQLFNSYTPFGMFFWMVGFILFLVIHMKTKDYAYSGSVTAVYFYVIGSSELGLIDNAYASSAMQWFGLILTLTVGYYIYKVWKG